MQSLVVLIALLGAAYAAGYFTRDYISRQRHERARLRRHYIDPSLSNTAADPNPTPAAEAHGELGQMLDRWQHRANARRSS